MGAIYHKNQPYSGVIVDQGLSTSSQHPVRNSVITNAINTIKGWIGYTIGPVTHQTGGSGISTITFTNNLITSSSELSLLSENTNNVPIFWSNVSIDNGTHTAVYTIPTPNTTEAAGLVFYLKIKNNWRTT